MNALVVYDWKFGNTKRVAEAIGEAIGGRVLHVKDVGSSAVQGSDLVIVGSPTYGGFPTAGIDALVKDSPTIAQMNAAVFDIRTKRTIFGYAAPKMARNLEKDGAILLAPLEGFFVSGRKGPLRDGELERAAAWAKGLAG